MATWEDGPEYAPIERPADFQMPEAPPLTTAPPHTQAAAWAPRSRPVFDYPSTPVRPLATLVPRLREEPRDPEKPFSVVASTMTTDSAWGAVHWASPTGQPVGTAAAPEAWRPTSAAPYPPPDQPIAVRAGSSAATSPFPAPGTPGWFSSGSSGPPPQQAAPVTSRSVLDAATPGLCMCLIIGGLVYVLAPIFLCVSVGLASRVKIATAEVRRAHVFGLVVLAMLGVVGSLIVGADFSEWWRFVGQWALLICWVLLAATLVMIYRRLKADTPNPPTYRSPWG